MVNDELKDREYSFLEWERLKKFFPGGVNSPVRSLQSVGTHPLIARRGKGAMLIDIDGNEYIDCCLSWGALLFGHAYPPIVEKVISTLHNGSSFGVTTSLEGDLAEKIQKAMPSMELLRFVSTGSEAAMTACRLARGFTKRSSIVKFSGHYHGHTDQFLVTPGSGGWALPFSSSAGIPDEYISQTILLPFNDLEALERLLDRYGEEIAAFILEPITANMGVVPIEEDFLKALIQARGQYGFLLIFDESITGFRVSFGGAQELYDVKPDLTCLGKSIGAGMPTAALGGKREVMELLAPMGEVYQAGTYAGNPLAMASGIVTLSLLESGAFYTKVEEMGHALEKGLLEICQRHQIPSCVQRVGSMWSICFGQEVLRRFEDLYSLDDKTFGHYFRSLLEKGVFLSPIHHAASFLSFSHTMKDVTYILELTDEALRVS